MQLAESACDFVGFSSYGEGGVLGMLKTCAKLGEKPAKIRTICNLSVEVFFHSLTDPLAKFLR